MRKPDIAKTVSPAVRAYIAKRGRDRLDVIFQKIVSDLRKGREASCRVWESSSTARRPGAFEPELASVMNEATIVAQLAQIVIRVVPREVVEIDGLGSLCRHDVLGFRFEPSQQPQVFVAYGKEDAEMVRQALRCPGSVGFDPWMDERKLVLGQNWPRAIESGHRDFGFFLACYSETSAVNKKAASRRDSLRAGLCYARFRSTTSSSCQCGNACRVPRSIQRECSTSICFPTGSADWPGWSRCCARSGVAGGNAEVKR